LIRIRLDFDPNLDQGEVIMPDKHKDHKPISDEALSLQPPLMTVLSDAAIQQAAEESFDLIIRLGPICDILRHPVTRTLMAIALYGDWSTGKTSSMRWRGHET
jgi:hypothetical protein